MRRQEMKRFKVAQYKVPDNYKQNKMAKIRNSHNPRIDNQHKGQRYQKKQYGVLAKSLRKISS